MPVRPVDSQAELAALREQLRLDRPTETSIDTSRTSQDEEELEYQRDLERWESEGGALGRVEN